MHSFLTATSGKVLASTAVVAAAAAVAGMGTFGSFTSTTSASTDTTTGTVTIALGAAGPANRLAVAATGVVPGDTIQRAFSLSNTGNQGLSSISLTTSATTSSRLDTDTATGLQMVVQSCSQPWVEAGVSPALTYTCPSPATTTTVVASRAVIGSNISLGSLQSLAAGSSDNLRLTLTLPELADNTLQNQRSVVNFAFTGLQRTATSR